MCFRHYSGSKINREWTVLSWRHGGSLQAALCDVTLSQTCCSPRASMVGDTEGALKCHNEHWALCFATAPKIVPAPAPRPAPSSRSVLASITHRRRLHNLLTGSQTNLNREKWPKTFDPFDLCSFRPLLPLRSLSKKKGKQKRGSHPCMSHQPLTACARFP